MSRHPANYFSGSRTKKELESLWKQARCCTARPLLQAAGQICSRLIAAGVRDAQLFKLPADGRTFCGGWAAPQAWDVKHATLTLLGRKPQIVLADYRHNPHSLMLWSPPTPKGGIEGEVVILEAKAEPSAAVKGKFVLLNDLSQVCYAIVDRMARAGAIGVLSDHLGSSKRSNGPAQIKHGAQYHNYANAPWNGDYRRLPAFSLTPANGARLRTALKRDPHLRLRACIDSRLYNGHMPLVQARLRGREREEIVLTAHLDEPGAWDNASGTAMCVELMRALAEYVRARGTPLRRSLRLLSSVEARGIQLYLKANTLRAPIRACINVDMVGLNPRKGRTEVVLVSAIPGTPSALEFVLEECFHEEGRRQPQFSVVTEQAVFIDDCHFAGEPFHAPTCVVEQRPDRTYHTSLDLPKNISAQELQRTGRALLRAVLFLADAEPHQIVAAGERMLTAALQQLKAPRAHTQQIIAATLKRWNDLRALMPETLPAPSLAEVAQLRRGRMLIDGYLSPRAAFAARIQRWAERLQLAAAAQAHPVQAKTAPAAPALKKQAQALVPQKTFAGYLGFEDLSRLQREDFRRRTGVATGWAAPGWLQWALDLSNGKRTLLDILQQMQQHGSRLSLQELIPALRALEKQGKVRFRPVLRKRDLLQTLERVGVRHGDLLMAHTALSDFGYFDGGAETVIDALLEAVGRSGTLCVPTHSLSWVGAEPYNPSTSPSLVGAVTNAFLKRPQALRSLHPTHSVAAIGPLAQSLLAGHDDTVAPQAREGFWGHFYEAQGKVLMLCRLGSNTLLHCGELWTGVPFPACQAHSLREGRRVEVTLPAMPWHTDSFTKVHELLKKKRLLKQVKFGDGVVSLMPAREAVDLQMKSIRANPLRVFPKKCECRWCGAVRSKMPVIVGLSQSKTRMMES